MRSPLAAGHFKPQPRISIAALPGAAKLGHTTAQACTRALSRLAGISWRVALDRIEETSAPASDGFTSAHTFASSQSDVAALIILDRPAISALIEALMGGAGTEEPFDTGDRPLSRIEDGLLTLACRSIAEEVAQALTAQFDRAFSSAMATAAPQPGQDWASFRLLLNVFSHSGEIRLSLARGALLELLKSASPEAAGAAEEAARREVQRQVGKSGVELVVTLGPETLSVEDIARLKPGRMIELSSTVATPVRLWSGGVAAFEGKLARAGDKLAISITAPVA